MKIGLGLGIELAVLSFLGEEEKKIVFEKLVFPQLVRLVEVYRGSMCFVVETRSLSSLKQLWISYKDGSLREKLKKAINEVNEVRKLTNGTEIDLTVEIDEDEYHEACWVLMLAEISQAEFEQPSSKSALRRRHSLPCKRDLPTRDKPHVSWKEWRVLNKAQNELMNETRKRKSAEQQVEQLKQEIERLKNVQDSGKSTEYDKKVPEEENQELAASELKPTKNLVEGLKDLIQFNEDRFNTALTPDDKIGEGNACSIIGLNYYALSVIYKGMNENENCQETRKKAESYLKQAINCWEKLNSQLNIEDKLKSPLHYTMFMTYKLLTTLLMDTQESNQTQEPAVVERFWAIDDQSALGFIVSLSAHLKVGQSERKLLKQKIKELKKAFDEPKYWAPIVLAHWI